MKDKIFTHLEQANKEANNGTLEFPKAGFITSQNSVILSEYIRQKYIEDSDTLLQRQSFSAFPSNVTTVTNNTKRAEYQQVSEHTQEYNGEIVDMNCNLVCNFIVDIRRFTESEISGKQEVLFTIHCNGKKSRSCNYDIAKFRSGIWVNDEIGLVCKSSELFKEYLEEKQRICCLPVMRECRSGGWKETDGIFDYLTKSGFVSGKSGACFVDEGGFDIKDTRTFDEKNAFKLYLQQANLTQNATALILLLYVVLAVQTSLLKKCGINLDFLILLLGERNSGKTSLALAMTELKCRTTSMRPEYNFSASHSSVKRALSYYGDGILLVDDIPPRGTGYDSEVDKLLEMLTRFIGQQTTGKTNTDYISKDFAKKVTYSTNGGAIVTAERDAGVESSKTRRVTLEVNGCVDFDLLRFYQMEGISVLPTFLWHFLRFVQKNQQKIFNMMEQIPARRSKLLGTRAAQRFCSDEALLDFAIDELAYYASELTCDIGDFVSKSQRAVSDVLERNDRELADNNPSSQVVDALWHWFSVGFLQPVCLANGTKSELGVYEDETFVYISSTVFFEKYEEFCKITGRVQAFDTDKQINKFLDIASFIKPEQEGKSFRRTIKITRQLKDENRRFLRFYKEMLLEKSSGFSSFWRL